MKKNKNKCYTCNSTDKPVERRLIYDEYSTLPKTTIVKKVCKDCADFLGVYENKVKEGDGRGLFF